MNLKQLSEKLSNFLIKKREIDAKLTQADVATRSDAFGIKGILDQRIVSRIEKQPLKASAINIAAYMAAIGCDPKEYFDHLTELTFSESIKSMDMINSNTRSAITTVIQSALGQVIQAQGVLVSNPHPYIKSLKLEERLFTATEALKGLDRKPVIGFFGHYDSGKSTLINTIVAKELLPYGYQPATSIVNLLMHETDRPKSLKGAVSLFKKGFMPHMIHDESLVKEFLIEDGDTSILDRLGIHDYDSTMPNDAYISIVFSEAKILERAWLMDTPGHLNEEESGDSEKAKTGAELVDGVVFLSQATGFLDNAQLYFGTDIIRQRPPVEKEKPLEHLLFVQSHCHDAIPASVAKDLGVKAFKRTRKIFDETVFKHWVAEGFISKAPDAADLASRLQPFWRENDEFRNGLMVRLNEMVDYLTEHHTQIVEKDVQRINKEIIRALAAAVSNLEAKKANVEKRVEEVQKQDARFREEVVELVSGFEAHITSCQTRKQEDLSTMKLFLEAKTNVDSLADLIEESYDSKKEAQAEVGNYIGQMLSSKVESTLKTSGKVFSNELDVLLDRWQKIAPSFKTEAGKRGDMDGLDLDLSGFNSRAAFIGGLSSIGSLGAMSLYVSTIASNLGAYLLVGKAAGVLTSLGLAGSVTSVTSFVAAIGGPITIGIAIAAAIGYAIYRIAGGSWQKGLAKKVKAALDKDDVWSKLESPVSEFWDNTVKATKAGLDELKSETDKHIEQMKEEAKTEFDAAELDKCVDVIVKMKATF
ncbi:dynamin family protein [Pseudomonadota bacterium]|uniref:dynamin family protein n=1 Tax=Shewanella sp. 6_MG-2023 TaxID=3062660 RepID=UPI0026E36DBD|nr:dynamin family protein [Shewanella sp. 6_MG-2023]MDO6620224.1 dynamin family protein [Shewanella sp. 6_MG-2023]